MKHLSTLPDDVTKELTSLVNQFVTIWNSKDAELFGSLFTDDAEFTDIVGQIARSKSEIIEQHRFPFEVTNKIAVLRMDDLYLRAIAPALAMVTGYWTNENSTSPQGKVLLKRSGVIQIICKQDHDQWKISLVHNTDHSQVFKEMVNTELRFFKTESDNGTLQ
uniref:SgcJ/EcaC family oxidoreductase n=1 Tax=Roseihalotalea indica TaxID=2867963 RepID=A0AA49JEU9_9BACT|nr:SgcJ/EcaC family oxidoreductase [Tunicatimonas sp. TK19036]